MRCGVPPTGPLSPELIPPEKRVRTVLSADTYGAGEADTLLGRALEGLQRAGYCLVGAVGHDFYEGEREGAKGYPRFTDPHLRGPDQYGSDPRLATEPPPQRVGAHALDPL